MAHHLPHQLTLTSDGEAASNEVVEPAAPARSNKEQRRSSSTTLPSINVHIFIPAPEAPAPAAVHRRPHVAKVLLAVLWFLTALAYMLMLPKTLFSPDRDLFELTVALFGMSCFLPAITHDLSAAALSMMILMQATIADRQHGKTTTMTTATMTWPNIDLSALACFIFLAMTLYWRQSKPLVPNTFEFQLPTRFAILTVLLYVAIFIVLKLVAEMTTIRTMFAVLACSALAVNVMFMLRLVWLLVVIVNSESPRGYDNTATSKTFDAVVTLSFMVSILATALAWNAGTPANISGWNAFTLSMVFILLDLARVVFPSEGTEQEVYARGCFAPVRMLPFMVGVLNLLVWVAALLLPSVIALYQAVVLDNQPYHIYDGKLEWLQLAPVVSGVLAIVICKRPVYWEMLISTSNQGDNMIEIRIVQVAKQVVCSKVTNVYKEATSSCCVLGHYVTNPRHGGLVFVVSNVPAVSLTPGGPIQLSPVSTTIMTPEDPDAFVAYARAAAIRTR